MGEWEPMDRNERPDRHGGESTVGQAEPDQPSLGSETEIMGSYDQLDGSSVFVIAALDRDDAWIAATNGFEVDPTDWR